MSTEIRFKRGTAAAWTSANTVLGPGEIGYETDTGRTKVGDGSTAWNSLNYNFLTVADIDVDGASLNQILRYDGSQFTPSSSVSLSKVFMTGTVDSNTVVATKQYVDQVSAGLNWHQAVRLATAAVLPNSPSYANGSADESSGTGIGATLTATTVGRLSVDGTNANNGDRVLVKTQANAVHNGIYVVTDQGSPSTYWVLTRATDANNSTVGQVKTGDAVYVRSGSYNINQGFNLNSVGSLSENVHQLGTDELTWTQFTGTATFVAGAGLSTSGNTINVGTADSGRIVVDSNTIDLAAISPTSGTGSSTLNFVKEVSVDSYGRVTAVNTASVALGSISTADIVEGGTNYYFTDERAQDAMNSALTAGTGISKSYDDNANVLTLSIGQNVDTGASVAFASVTATAIAGTVTGNVNGNATTASALQSPRIISINGAVSGSTSFDGSQNVIITTTSGGDAVPLGTGTTGDYIANISGGTGVNVTGGSGESASATVSIGQDVSTTSSVTFAAVTAPIVGNVTGDLTGNASTASTLQNQRTISLSGDVSGSVSFNGGSDATITTTVQPNSVALGTDTTGNYVSSLIAGTGVTLSNNSGESATPTVAIGQAVETSSSVTFARVETTGNVVVGGDLFVTGTTTTVNETNLAIADTFIYLNDGSTSTNPDLGWVGNYNDGTYKHAGLFRDATDGKFKFFDSYTEEPTDPINTGHASYAAAPLVVRNLESTVPTGTAPFTVSSSTVVTNLNADLLDGQSIAYFAPSASPTLTGTTTFPSGATVQFQNTSGTAPFSVSSSTVVTNLNADLLDGQSIAYFAPINSPTFTGTVTLPNGTITNAMIASNAAIELSKLADIAINAQTASYTLVLSDRAKIVEISNASANTLTVPLNSSVAFPIGTQIQILQTGAGQTTVAGTGGVTVNGTPGLKLRAQWSSATLIKRGTDTWVLIGDISA